MGKIKIMSMMVIFIISLAGFCIAEENTTSSGSSASFPGIVSLSAGDSKSFVASDGTNIAVSVIGVNTASMTAMINVNGESKQIKVGETATLGNVMLKLDAITTTTTPALQGVATINLIGLSATATASTNTTTTTIPPTTPTTTTQTTTPFNTFPGIVSLSAGDSKSFVASDGTNIAVSVIGVNTQDLTAMIKVNGESKQMKKGETATLGNAMLSLDDITTIALPALQGVATINLIGLRATATPPTITTTTTTSTNTIPTTTPTTTTPTGIAIPTINPTTTTATSSVSARPAYSGFRYAKWECYDGKSETQGSESSCKPSELWQKYAQESCAGHCYSDKSKCGVNSFGVSIECGDNVPAATNANIAAIGIAVPAASSGITVVSVSDVEVCYKKLRQENPSEKEDVLWMKCKLMTRQQPAAIAVSQQPAIMMPAQQCDAANQQLMNELSNAAQKYETIKREGRSEADLKSVQEYIQKIKEKIGYNKNNCWNSAAQVASTSAMPECEIVNANLKKELEEGYIKTRMVYQEGDPERIKEIDNYMMQLKNKVMKNRESCWSTTTAGGEAAIAKAVPVVSTSWVSAETSPSDVTTYYQAKMGSILADTNSIDSQITQLKDLRNKIDVMIEELIKKKEVIGTDDFNGLVTEFKVNSKEISADNVKFDSANKEFVKNIGDKSVSIKQGEDNVVLTVDNVEVNAPEFAITDKIKVEDIELKALPDKIKNQVNEEDIKDIGVAREDDKLVYNVKTEEERKILGLFQATAEKNTVLDASSENADLIKEEKPWWYGISGEVKK